MESVKEILEKKYGWDFGECSELQMQLITDTAEAAVEQYKQNKLKTIPLPGNNTQEKVLYSLMRMRNFFEAIQIDRDYVLAYRNKTISEDKLIKAIKESFPKINFFIKVITDDLKNDPNVSQERLEKNEQLTYYLLECHEELMKKV